MADDVLQQIDQDGNKVLFRAPEIAGKKYPQAILTDPADGAAIKPASQADVQAIRDRLPSAGAASDDGLAAILAELAGKVEPGDLAALATADKQDTGNTALASILAKIIAAPATEAKQDAGNTSLGTLVTSMAGLAAAVATETTLAAIAAKLPALTSTIPPDDGPATPVRQVPVDFWRCGFAGVGAGLVTPDMQLEQVGSGMAVSQSAGNLVITTGTTTNAETVIRSVRSFHGAMVARFKTILSQRIANNTFRVELADLVGQALAYTINSATSVTVTFPAGTNPFTAAHVGQSMRLSEITGAAGIPGRFAIASTSGDTVTFTVAAWPATGTGTLTIYGRNYIQSEYSGTTATNASVDAQRDGWNSGNTTATINTTASPGHVMQVSTDILSAAWSDGLVASNAAVRWTERADRIENIPDDDTELYLFIVAQNGSTAPASTTTWTIGYVQVEAQGRQKVRIASSDPTGAMQALPVAIRQAVALSLSALPALVAGTAAIGDVGMQARANATGAASKAHLVSAATTNATIVKASAGRLLGWCITNTNAAIRYVKLHNQATSPTAGAGVVETIGVPPNQTISGTATDFGSAFTTGIGMTTVTDAADAGTTAVGAGDLIIDLYYA